MVTEEIKPGDVVQLKSGGPAMTVSSIEDGTAHCIWFEKNKQDFSSFAVHMLKPCQEPPLFGSSVRG